MGKPFLFPCDLASQGWGEGRGEPVWLEGTGTEGLFEGKVFLVPCGLSSEQIFPCYGACLSPEDCKHFEDNDKVHLLTLEPGVVPLNWLILEAMFTMCKTGTL